MNLSPELAKKLYPLLRPNQTAVIVIDKQAGYFDPKDSQSVLFGKTKNLLPLVPKIDQFILEARQLHIPIIWTQMIENIEQSRPGLANKMKREQTHAIIKQGEPSFEFYGDVTPQPDEKIIIKYYFSAFADTDLAEHLKNLGITTIVLIGGYTSRCVLATAFSANAEDMNVFVTDDLVGVADHFAPEQPIALGIIESILGNVVDSKFILEAW